jgi:hypothetical protein
MPASKTSISALLVAIIDRLQSAWGALTVAP